MQINDKLALPQPITDSEVIFTVIYKTFDKQMKWHDIIQNDIIQRIMQPENRSWTLLRGLTGWDKPQLKGKHNFSYLLFILWTTYY